MNLKKIGVGFVFLWFFGGGCGHFAAAKFFVAILPPYIPWPYPVVYLSGAFEIFAALCLLHLGWRKIIGNCLFLFTIAVSPVNIHMWSHPEIFPEVPPLFLSIRLVVQVLLLACIWWSTRPDQTQPSAGANPQSTEA